MLTTGLVIEWKRSKPKIYVVYLLHYAFFL